jgi:gdmH
LKLKNIRIIKIFLGVFLLFFLLTEFLIIREYLNDYNERNQRKKMDYVIVLGGKLYGEVPSNSLKNRIMVAVKYLLENKDTKVVVTGGKGPGEKITEAKAMEKELIKNGINQKRIIVEDKSRNTVQNFKYSLLKIKEDKSLDISKKKKIMIVTNDYHMYRAKKIARATGLGKEGFEIYGLPAKTPIIAAPKAYLREFLSNVKFWIFGINQD